MDNQHKKIAGYRDLSQEEIDLMNEVKQKGVELEQLISKLERLSMDTNRECNDYTWLHEGKVSLQKGLMYLVRYIARPTTF